MADQSQMAHGALSELPNKDAALAAFPIYEYLSHYKNFFETSEGINGLKIIKPAIDGTGVKFTLNGGGDESDNVEPPKAFDLALAYDSGSGNTTATCSNLYEISGLVQLCQAGTISVSLSDSDAYLGYEYTFATRVVTLVTGATLANVSESSQPAATATSYKRALYYLIQSGDSWYISVDLRNQPVNVVRM